MANWAEKKSEPNRFRLTRKAFEIENQLWISTRKNSKAARKKINRIVEKIVHIQEQGVEPVEYFREFMTGLLTCLAAPAGAAWMRTPAGHLQVVYQINFWQAGLSEPQSREEHSELLRSVIQGQRPVMLSQTTKSQEIRQVISFFSCPLRSTVKWSVLWKYFKTLTEIQTLNMVSFSSSRKWGNLHPSMLRVSWEQEELI